MDPKSPPSSSGQFLVPMGRARRKSVSSSTPADSVPGPSSASTSAAAAAANASTNTRANASQTFPGSTQGEGVVIYKKPIITPSQIAPTQATQLIEGLDEEDSSDEVRPPSVSMHGHGATFHQELVLRSEIDTYVFGTASDCDIIISHKHWRDIEAVQVPDSIPWFKVQLQGNRARDEIIFVTIEKVWSGISNEKTDKKIIRGELSSYRPDGLELGNGAYARVYTVVDEQTSGVNKKVYACKEVDHLEREYSRAVFENLLHEITVLKRLNHVENFKTYIITEFIEGWTLLKDYGIRNNFYSEVDARRYFKQVCEAINYLHSHNIVHRDIKSENIMIEGETNVVKLIDFGLARNSNTQPIMTTLCGTYHYMAPETAYGDEKNGYGRAVDIWSLGALLFRMLSAVYPSEANTPAADAVANLEGLLKEQRKRKDERRRAAEETPGDIAESSTSGETNHSARKEDRDEGLHHSPQGKIPTYTENWGECLDRQIPRTPEVPYTHYLKYTLEIVGASEPTQDEIMRRKLEARPVDWSPNRSEVPQPQQQQQQGDPWAVLIPLSDKTKEEQLFKAVIVMGRDLNCDVIIRDDYISRERLLNDIERYSPIYAIVHLAGESSETPEIGYTIHFTAEDERPQKRLRAMSIDP
ncbi:hypothetical protein BGZ98_009065 [Dissophora globulifera]|nr:hypothetical protein BGZ98_009065 [Dissophora globulifera]